MHDQNSGRYRNDPPRERLPQWRTSDAAERPGQADRERPSGQNDRERPRERPDRLDRVRDAAQIRARVDRLRTIEREHPNWGHTFREHVLVTDPQLEERVKTGVNARGQHGPMIRHATRWQSAEAMVTAVDRLRNSDEFHRGKANAEARQVPQFEVRRPLSEVLGPEWRGDVYGQSRAPDGTRPCRWRSDSAAFALWRRQSDGRWHLYTCYPEPEKKGPAGR